MALFEITPVAFRPIGSSSFTDMNVKERGDLQRLLRSQIEVLDENLYVLAEEFSEWEDSRRRIDLLAMDSDGNLVVIELKRTVDGGHMELQAIRYASMVSAMTFERAIRIHGAFLDSIGIGKDAAKKRMLDFLGWDEPDEELFASDVRILLVSEGFGRELTTAVLWLRERSVDIRCIRMRPYQDGEQQFVDVQQIIPLPEANDYQVQLREKGQAERKHKAERYVLRLKFWTGLVAMARERGTRHGSIKPGSWGWLGASSGVRGLGLNFSIKQHTSQVELYIDRGDEEANLFVFDELLAKREQIEMAFGGTLDWQRLDTKRACRIRSVLDDGGYRDSESQWPGIHNGMLSAMTRLEEAIMPHIDDIAKQLS